MKGSYCGNIKPFAAVLYAHEDGDKVLPILETVSEAGKELCYDRAQAIKKDNLKKASAVIVFVTEGFSKDKELQNAVLEARSMETPIIPVVMSEEGLPETLRPFLAAANSVMADGQVAAEKMLEAESMQMRSVTKAQSNAMKKVTRTLVTVAVLVIAATALLILKPWNRNDSAPAPSPTVTAAEVRENLFGLTEEELLKITRAVIVEDSFITSKETILSEEWDDDVYWYAWKTDDYGNAGERVRRGTASQEDFEIISRMPNLLSLVIVGQNITKLPDLSGLTNLTKIVIWDTPIDDISGVSGCPSLNEADFRQTRISDLSPLNSCERLRKIFFRNNPKAEECTLEELNGFSPPMLESANFHQCYKLKSVTDSLADCKNLKYLQLGNATITDISFLRDLPLLQSIQLSDMPGLSDLSPLENKEELHFVTLSSMPLISDISFLESAQSLLEFKASDCPGLSDLSPLSGKTQLARIELESTDVRDMSFLNGISSPGLMYLSVRGGSTGRISDWSGIGSIKRYSTLEVSSYGGGRMDAGRILSCLDQDVSVNKLSLGWAYNLNLEQLPSSVTELLLDGTDITSLEGIGHLDLLSSLCLSGLSKLTSLNGIQNCSKLRTIRVDNCPKLTDVMAMYGNKLNRKNWKSIQWCNMPELNVDFSKIKLEDKRLGLQVEGIPSLEDLSFLDKCAGFDWINLCRLENVTDFSALMNIRYCDITCPAQTPLKVLEVLKENKNTVRVEETPEENEGVHIEFRLESLEELKSLPETLLKYVTEFSLIGDTLITEGQDWETDWTGEAVRYVINNGDTGVSTQAGKGIMMDLSLIDKLTGLRKLELVGQPLESLEGIQKFQDLQKLDIRDCTSITDISPAFGIRNLECLNVRDTSIESIQGIQNLTRLISLEIDGTKVVDLSPLAECDFTYAAGNGGLNLNINNLWLNSIASLSEIPEFSGLWVWPENWDELKQTENWSTVLKQSEIQRIGIRIDSNEELAELLQQHPELEELYIQGSEGITDLTPVLDMPNLRYIRVSSYMSEAIASIEGKYEGELEIEG